MIVALVALSAQALFLSTLTRAQDRPHSTTENSATPQAAPAHDFARWEREIAGFEAADRIKPPPKGGVLFIGASGIRLWKSLAEDFPDHKVINRGFGGSEIRDSTHFADRIIFPYEPRQIFLRAGGNDIHNGGLPFLVAGDFLEFCRIVHQRLPNTEILFIGASPAPARWGESDKYVELNRRIREGALNMPRVGYIDVYPIGIKSDGNPRYEVFVADKLHFNAEGYKLLADRVRPYLMTTR
jgi:lysophospholipase L1-like esterase